MKPQWAKVASDKNTGACESSCLGVGNCGWISWGGDFLAASEGWSFFRQNGMKKAILWRASITCQGTQVVLWGNGDGMPKERGKQEWVPLGHTARCFEIGHCSLFSPRLPRTQVHLKSLPSSCFISHARGSLGARAAPSPWESETSNLLPHFQTLEDSWVPSTGN